jgi:hypothetical protein
MPRSNRKNTQRTSAWCNAGKAKFPTSCSTQSHFSAETPRSQQGGLSTALSFSGRFLEPCESRNSHYLVGPIEPICSRNYPMTDRHSSVGFVDLALGPAVSTSNPKQVAKHLQGWVDYLGATVAGQTHPSERTELRLAPIPSGKNRPASSVDKQTRFIECAAINSDERGMLRRTHGRRAVVLGDPYPSRERCYSLRRGQRSSGSNVKSASAGLPLVVLAHWLRRRQ